MSKLVSQSDSILGQLVEEFLARRRAGEQPSASEYIDRHPELAGRIREIFPALGLVEAIKPGSGEATLSVPRAEQAGAGLGLERLVDYRIIREVGRGGMGIVYEAEQESLRRRVALKVLARQATRDGTLVERFHREARSAARVHHTNIVPIFEVGQAGEVLYYAMQFIPGQSLDRVIDELRRLREPAPPYCSGPAGPVSRMLWTGRFAGASEAGMVAVADASAGERLRLGRARSVARRGVARRARRRANGRDPAGGVGGIVGRAAGRDADLGRRVEHESPAPLCPQRGPDRLPGGRGAGARPRTGDRPP